MPTPRHIAVAVLSGALLACTGAVTENGGAREDPVDTPPEVTSYSDPPSSVRTEPTAQGWVLLRNGEPYFIRGAGGSEHLDALVAAGGNSIRTWGVNDGTRDLLDAAQTRGLTVTVGLWLGHPEHGFDYSDETAVAEQREAIRRAVVTLRDHPALLIWGVGNEVEIAVDEPFVWEAIDDIARMVHFIDPNHPTMAVTAELGEANERRLAELAPEIDIWGINSYGGIASLPDRLDERGYDGPYIVTELAHYGTWESPTTDWNSPVEPASADKSTAYARAWQNTVTADTARCLGGYAFYWQSAVHPTDTWYPLFTHDGRPLAPVDTLTSLWTGEWPSNLAPLVRGLNSEARGAVLTPGAAFSAVLDAEDPEGEPLEVSWLLAPDASFPLLNGPVWNVPRRCDPLESESGLTVSVAAPDEPGTWRLLAFAADPGGRVGFASLPFFVEDSLGSAADTTTDAARLPLVVDDYFAPSGWMGHTAGMSRNDCEHPDGICGGPCHRFSVEPGGEGWAGVWWQYPVNNWGDQPGLPVLGGAREVRWRAWTDGDNVDVNFFAGMRGPDGFNRETGDTRLSSEPTQYSLSLEGVTYDEITGAFGWAVALEEPATIIITDVEWVR